MLTRACTLWSPLPSIRRGCLAVLLVSGHVSPAYPTIVTRFLFKTPFPSYALTLSPCSDFYFRGKKADVGHDSSLPLLLLDRSTNRPFCPPAGSSSTCLVGLSPLCSGFFSSPLPSQSSFPLWLQPLISHVCFSSR